MALSGMKNKKRLFGFAAAAAMFVFLLYETFAPDVESYLKFRMLLGAEANLMALIEAEDRYYQRSGAYLPLAPDSENSDAKKTLGWCAADGCSGCAYAVSVSGLAFTAEVRCPTRSNEFHYLGYVRTAPGSHVGVVGNFGKCGAEGIYAVSRKLVNVVGPCGENTWKTLAVVSGHRKSLAIETIPADTGVFINGEKLGETFPFRGTVSGSYGYLFLEKPPKTPIEVVISREGYSTVRFSLDWADYTYQATIPLRPN